MASLDEEICEEHAGEAAFLWSRRDRAVHDEAYDLQGLAELDRRIEAHVDGLRVSEGIGLAASAAALDEEAEAGAAFVSMLLAVERLDLPRIARVLDAAGADPEAARGIVSALGWAPLDRVRAIVPALLARACAPALHYVGIGACAVHRRDPGPALANALHSDDPRLLRRALRAAGELGRVDLLPAVKTHLDAGDEALRFWAAWAAALLGDAPAAEALWSLAAGSGRFAERAGAMAVRRLPAPEGLSRISLLARTEGGARPALAAAAALGDPSLVPWLFERMGDPGTARRAAFALTMITGLVLEQQGLEGPPLDGFSAGPNDDPDDDDVAVDPDESLPWPHVARLRGWWDVEGARFREGTRYFLGRPLDGAGLEAALRAGRQPVREAAAVELALGRHRRTLPEVRAPGFSQLA